MLGMGGFSPLLMLGAVCVAGSSRKKGVEDKVSSGVCVYVCVWGGGGQGLVCQKSDDFRTFHCQSINM